ncbi:hypothetical protein [Xanthomonas albilineans]|uniref:hypothetical protein n=1 Tax=Xanthomonas albilineans TaxID=29447 RepID=UPI001E56E9E9|nr:hypothetical protein [Xanthomonas albilineans]
MNFSLIEMRDRQEDLIFLTWCFTLLQHHYLNTPMRPPMKTVSFLLTTAIAALCAIPALAAPRVVTLGVVQVHPSAEQLAQRHTTMPGRIVTLTTVQVRPSADLIALRDAEQAASSHLPPLATVHVYPDANLQPVFALGNEMGSVLKQLWPDMRQWGQALARSE